MALHQHLHSPSISVNNSLARSVTTSASVIGIDSSTLLQRVGSGGGGGGAIPISQFAAHVASTRQEGGGFAREFEALQEWETRRKALMEEAAAKKGDEDTEKKIDMISVENRYSNVVACEFLIK
jgi:hypothetical protein